MLNSSFIKEYLPTIFYIIVIFNIIFRVIQSKKNKKGKTKKKKRKGGGNISKIFWDFLQIIWCIITFGIGNGCWWDGKNKGPTPRQITNWDGSGRDFGDWDIGWVI